MQTSRLAVSTSKKLLQTQVDKATFRKFKKLASAAGNTLAGYLRHLIQTHVKAHENQEIIRDLLDNQEANQ